MAVATRCASYNSNQMRLFITKSLKDLQETKLSPGDMVCLIVPDVKYVYKTIDRINSRAIVISYETFSDTVSIKLYQKFMKDRGLKHMCLIARTSFVESDICAVSRCVNPDDVIRLDV